MSVRYAYHLETRKVRENDFPYSSEPLQNPLAVVNFTKALQDSDIEKFLILYLNTKNRLICIEITSGTIDHQVIYPREIVKHALLSAAASIIIVHNHPSGIPEPSPEDRAITKAIREACQLLDIRTLDHIVVGEDGKYYSFQENRIL